MLDIASQITAELKLQEFQVRNAIKLMFEEGCTIPFVARYRKEKTGSMDEVNLRSIRDRHVYLTELVTSRAKYLKVVEEHCQKRPELAAQWPELQRKFNAAMTKQELEDLYLPFKPKRRTRAQVAKEKGLEPLADKILASDATMDDLPSLATAYVTAKDSTIDAALRVEDAQQALVGAADIIAERLAETAELRALVRRMTAETGMLTSQKTDSDTKTGETIANKNGKPVDINKYQNYFNYREPVLKAAAHRVMAIRRGEAEKVLKVNIEVDSALITKTLEEHFLANRRFSEIVRTWLRGVIEDAYRRLLNPSIETEIRLELKSRAEEEAIRVFAKNLQNLLLLPPIPGKVVMGIDPGLRTGCKIAVVSATGKLLATNTIYPELGRDSGPKTEAAKKQMLDLIRTHQVQCIAIGNGTGSREINRVVVEVLKENQLSEVKRVTVNEAGASVYSTDDIAREEFPDLDPTLRGAVSIGRRLQDPLAELVKIDPRSIGVGQYQHDVNVNKLKSSLEEVVESCVNRVGVNLNTASYKLLGYVSGIGPVLAKNIVSFRDQSGGFKDRQQLLKVAGFGPKAFEQAAGFLRVPSATNPLDNSAVHPERYDIVEQIAKDLQRPISDIIGQKPVVEAVHWEKYVSDTVGMPTLTDIAAELIKPGRDPREDGARLMFSEAVSTLEDLKINMVLPGTVTNVTNFGAFVDIGVHQDGLVHISELSNEFVKDPAAVIAVGDIVQVRVMDVDIGRKRISLSCRLNPVKGGAQATTTPATKSTNQRPTSANQTTSPRGGRQPHSKGKPQAPAQPQRQYTAEDLLAKFNRR